MLEFILNVKSIFLFRILVETKKKLLPLLLCKLLRIMLLLQILTIDIVALSFFNVKYGKDHSLFLGKVLFFHFLLGEKTMTLTVSCSGRAVFCFILFYQSLGISSKIFR